MAPDTAPIAERYRRFARTDAAGRSPLYVALALHVAQSDSALRFLARLPQDRQQPNLLFAALRLVAGKPETGPEFDAALGAQADRVAEVMLARTTQTNEPGRCATLMPLLSQIEGPLALIEVGASAGLCLLPDAYGYDWQRQTLAPPDPLAPVFPCTASPGTPLPTRHPEVVWRAGLDLNPLDVNDPSDLAWLEALVWPENTARLMRQRQAITVARQMRPRVVAGDLRHDLPALIAEAPRDATVVVFHTAVLCYVPRQGDRDAFAARMAQGGDRLVWISNEGPRSFLQFARTAGPLREEMFLMARNGQPVAWAAPHGQEISWFVT